jgi:hypothetical protein
MQNANNMTDCPKLKTASERENRRHIVLKHPGKLGYPNISVAGYRIR